MSKFTKVVDFFLRVDIDCREGSGVDGGFHTDGDRPSEVADACGCCEFFAQELDCGFVGITDPFDDGLLFLCIDPAVGFAGVDHGADENRHLFLFGLG